MKKLTYIVAFLLLISVPLFVTERVKNSISKISSQEIKQTQSQTQNPPVSEKRDQTFLVTRVVDGDTIEISGGQKLRYIGIDTPETVDPARPVGCFGKEASNKNKALVEGKKVRLEKDVSETDKYGRLLRYVYVDDVFVNQNLVAEGFAKASSYPPDVKYQEIFRAAEKAARENNKGLWGSCNSGSVQGAAAISNSQTSSINSETCTIKGNISSSKEKIYHLPGQKYYSQTVIDESKGERWFCTETDAQKAGWRKSKV